MLQQRDIREFFDVSISPPWLTYGPLLCALCLNLIGTHLQLGYNPKDYGQYVDPHTNSIWTIVDSTYLASAYSAGVLKMPDKVTWLARRDASTGLPLDSSAASD